MGFIHVQNPHFPRATYCGVQSASAEAVMQDRGRKRQAIPIYRKGCQIVPVSDLCPECVSHSHGEISVGITDLLQKAGF